MEIVFSGIAGVCALACLGIFFEATRASSLAVIAILITAELCIWFLVPQFRRRLITGLTANTAETGSAPEFPELRERTYGAPPSEVFEAAAAIVKSLPNWRLVSADPATLTIRAERKVLHYIDDATIRVMSAGGGSRVDAWSHSRVGKGDFGENRRHIREILEGLDRKFASDQPVKAR